MCDTSEESVSTAIQLFEDGDFVGACSIRTDNIISLDDFCLETLAEDLANMIEEYLGKLWYSSSKEKDLEFAKLLRKNKEEIFEGNRQEKIKELLEEKKKIEEKLLELNNMK